MIICACTMKPPKIKRNFYVNLINPRYIEVKLWQYGYGTF